MKTAEALQLLRTKGTLRADDPPGNTVARTDLNQPLARAVRDLVRRTSSFGKEQPWMPPSSTLQPLP